MADYTKADEALALVRFSFITRPPSTSQSGTLRLSFPCSLFSNHYPLFPARYGQQLISSTAHSIFTNRNQLRREWVWEWDIRAFLSHSLPTRLMIRGQQHEKQSRLKM